MEYHRIVKKPLNQFDVAPNLQDYQKMREEFSWDEIARELDWFDGDHINIGHVTIDAHLKTGRCLFRVDNTLQAFDTEFYARDRIPVDQAIQGPAIVLQTDATTVVPPGATFTVHTDGNLIIRLETKS